MTRDVVIAEPDDTYQVVLERMMRGHIRHLPVVSNGRLVGFVSFRGLVLQDVALKGAAPKMLSTAVHLTAATVGALAPLWKCHACGHLEKGDAPPERCPGCAAPREQFALLEEY